MGDSASFGSLTKEIMILSRITVVDASVQPDDSLQLTFSPLEARWIMADLHALRSYESGDGQTTHHTLNLRKLLEKALEEIASAG